MDSSVVSGAELQGVRQRRESLRDAMRIFEEALAMPAAGRVERWKGRVQQATKTLEAHLVEHVATTEGPAGFHHEIVSAAPRLSHAVGVLVRDHADLRRRTATIAGHLQDARAREDVDRVRELGTELITHLSRHRQRGADLIYEAYEFDLGGEE